MSSVKSKFNSQLLGRILLTILPGLFITGGLLYANSNIYYDIDTQKTIVATTGGFNVSYTTSLATTTITGDLTVNTNDLYVDTATGNVGIGTTSPGYKLDVNGDVNISSGHNFKINGSNLSASDIDVLQLGSPTYTSIQDLINTTQSAGKLTGGDITDNGNGTVSIAAGTGLIRTTDSDTGELKFFDWSTSSSVSLTDNSINYIYVDYNSGSPQIGVYTSIPSDTNTKILLGCVYREGENLHITTAGQVITNYIHKDFWKDIDLRGKFQRVNGLKPVSYTHLTLPTICSV